jgi:carbamoylphosphate synthase large subunit
MESVAQTPVTSALIVDVLQRAADKIGAVLTIEPEWGCVGQVRYKSGVCRYFRLSTLDLNPMGASEIARDKGYARFFLAQMGHPVAEGNTFLSTERAAMLRRPERGGVDAAWSYAEALGLPVFVKPNSLSRGVGVAKANTREEFRRAAQKAFEHDRVIVVEKAVTGKDYRLVVLDGVVISA